MKDLLESKIIGKTVKILGAGAMSQNAQTLCAAHAEFFTVYSRQAGNWTLRNTKYDVLINTTSIGMDGVEVPVDELKEDLIIDCVIGDTPLIKQAIDAGKEYITGYDLYLAQLKHQAKLYTGITIEQPYEFLL